MITLDIRANMRAKFIAQWKQRYNAGEVPRLALSYDLPDGQFHVAEVQRAWLWYYNGAADCAARLNEALWHESSLLELAARNTREKTDG